MQRKTNILSQTPVTQMHFAVVPYEVQYLVPNDQVYQIYFEKGLQILGTTQYPIENHQKIKSIQLPIANNVIPFRLFSERNSQYQWSIYKRVSDMQEYLESKKINLKDILKKQPLKKLQLDKKNKTERKDSSNMRRNDPKISEIKGIAAKTSQFKPSDTKSSQLKTLDQNSTQKLSQVSVQGKGCIYDQQIKSDLGHFILKFYVFRAFSHQQLSKTIEEKSRQKKQVRTPLSQISVNKISQLPKVSEIQPKIQQETKKDQINEPILEQQRQKQVQIYPTLLLAQKTQQLAEQLLKESAKQLPVQQIATKEQKQQAIQEKVEQKIVAQQAQEIQTPAVLEGSSHQIVQSPIHGEKFAEQQPPVEQVPPFVEQTTNEQLPIIAKKAPFVFSTGKKLFVVSILMMIVLYVLYSMNILDNTALPQTPTVVPKKEKKEKFSNRKKIPK